MRYIVDPDFEIGRIGVETVITTPNGDVLVLNETAGQLLHLVRQGASQDAAVAFLIENYEVAEEIALRDVTALLYGLLVKGVISEDRRYRKTPPSPGHRDKTFGGTRLGRRGFVVGAAALGVSLLIPPLAFDGKTAALADDLFHGRSAGDWDGDSAGGFRTWTDSLGRRVEVPVDITCVAPFGAYAQAMLESVVPKSVVSISRRGLQASFVSETENSRLAESSRITAERQDKSIDPEMVATYSPDVIISIENSPDRDKPLLGALRDDIDVPLVHIVASPDEIPQAFRTLGDFLGEDRAYEMADFVARILLTFAQGRELITQKNQKSVYFGTGTLGFDTMGRGSQFESILEMIGAKNIAHDLTGAECLNVPFGHLVSRSPSLVVLSMSDLDKEPELHRQICDAWLHPAIFPKTDIHLAPSEPVDWFNGSPLTSQTLGALWIAKLLYPEVYTYDLEQVVSEYFGLFFHRELSKHEASILMKSTHITGKVDVIV
jgi:iron complex transport system substrate-binding protein